MTPGEQSSGKKARAEAVAKLAETWAWLNSPNNSH